MFRAAYILLVTHTVLGLSTADAQIPDPIKLWPDGAPGAKGDAEHDTPTIRPYLVKGAKATGAAVIVCPGGGYGALASDHEGHQVARWFNRFGVSAFVLRYRHAPHYQHPTPLEDAQRAIRLVRSRAAKFGIDPGRVGIMGFSAGGHLASTAATHFDSGKDAKDSVESESCRPDFAVLCYPVVTMKKSFTHRGSVRNLLGAEPSGELLENLSNETQVTAETPPTFLFHTAEDKAVPVQNSLVFFQALLEHGVKAELHVYQNGQHGIGLAPGDPVATTWKERLADWMKANGLLKTGPRAAVSGSVSMGGQPLRWGMVTFAPREGAGPIASAMISRGKFSIPASTGPQVGQHSVVIRSLGDVLPQPTIDDAVLVTPDPSPLTIQVAPQGNEFNFELQ